MSVAPAKDLSQHFRHGPILASAGIPVKGLTPEVTTCPFCRQTTLSIYSDPTSTTEGRWFHCTGCDFSGDSVELYGRLKGYANLADAVRQGFAEGYGNLTPANLAAPDIEAYLQLFPMHRQQQRERWKKLRLGLKQQLSPDIVERLQSEHLWGGWRNGYHKRVTRFMGCRLRRDVMDILRCDARLLPKTDFRTVLALNFQDAPGRTSSFMLIGDAGRRVIKQVVPNFSDGGLAMLDFLRPYEELVFAVDDPMFGFHLQCKHAADMDDPLKLIVFNDATEKAWNSVVASRVILWSRTPTWRVFKHARRINGFVTFMPRFNRGEIYDYVHVTPLPTILRRMEENAKPWRVALCIWLVAKERTEAEAREALYSLGLTYGDRQEVLQECPSLLRHRVSQLLGSQQIYEVRIVKNHKVSLREDGFYVIFEGNDERISDIAILLSREICDQATGKVIWCGSMRFKGVEIPFQSPLEEIEKNVKGWIYSHTARAGLGTPYLAPVWVSQLTHLIRLFSSPKPAKAIARVGIQPNGDILFPQFKLVDGKIEADDTLIGLNDVPAVQVAPPVVREARPHDVHTATRACWMAAVSAYITNLLALERQLPPTPVVMAGSYGSMARFVGRSLANGAGMRIVIADSLKTVEETRKRMGEYGYPTYVETSRPGQLNKYPSVNQDNVFLVSDYIDAATIIVGDRWLVIHAPSLVTETHVPPFNDVLLYLADLQTRDYELPEAEQLYDSVLRDFSTWYAAYMGGSAEENYDSAKKFIYASEHPGDCLLDLYFALRHRGNMEIDYRPVVKEIAEKGILTVGSNYAAIIDTDEGKVFLSRTKLFRRLHGDKLPAADVSAAIDDLNRRGMLVDIGRDLDGWIVPLSYWNKCAETWKSRQRASS